ncbi:MAG: tyrosine-type recombinase/integrase [Solirubrobacteraceae bacterium]
MWSANCARSELERLAAKAGVRRRFAPHQLHHAHAVELAREAISLPVIQRQLGHAHLESRVSTWVASIPARSSTRSTPAVRP